MHPKHAPAYDEPLVLRITSGATQRKIRTEGEFGHFVRPYLEAGYPREVAEAHRRFFKHGYHRGDFPPGYAHPLPGPR